MNWGDTTDTIDAEANVCPLPFTFTTYFQGEMGMYAPADQVATYLNDHAQWFTRCAQPMTAEPFGPHGYILTVGQFSSFGYEVEPKMAVMLDPPRDRIYDMYSVDVPDYETPGYDINYNASLTLREVNSQEVPWGKAQEAIAPIVTQVSWYLNLHITLQFPRFIYRLPHDLLQRTGETGLAQIIRQVSPRLTYKVQKDFHQQQQLPMPPRSSRKLDRVQTATTSHKTSA